MAPSWRGSPRSWASRREEAEVRVYHKRELAMQLHAHDGRTLNELFDHLDMARQGVTQHLNQLESADLLVTVRRGSEAATGGIQWVDRRSYT